MALHAKQGDACKTGCGMQNRALHAGRPACHQTGRDDLQQVRLSLNPEALSTGRCMQGGLRVTEQGEMVHSKFGSPDIAQVTLESFTTAVLEANLCPPPPPRCESWRGIMEELGKLSCDAYRCAPTNA